MDTRGTLFFDIERILKEKKPAGFILENVEGLKTHDRVDPKKPIGRTLETIIKHLEELGYNVSWKVLDASLYGVPQRRKRIYIAGSKNKIDLENLPIKPSKLSDVLEAKVNKDLYIDTPFTKKLLSHYDLEYLKGKQIKDKRGGNNNIHSWDIELKGKVSIEQKELIEELLKQRRRKSWALHKGIDWADGMPLTLEEIKIFHEKPLNLFTKKDNPKKNTQMLEAMLEDLVTKGYLVKEKPKRAPDWYQNPGYNIVAGKLSFEISNILDPDLHTPTLVATDVTRLAVADKNGLRRLSVREGLRLFGFPEAYILDGIISYKEAFDLLGNSVSVGAIKIVSERLIKAIAP
jgi:DNA (cytosine-5)-methyltransferase 1